MLSSNECDVGATAATTMPNAILPDAVAWLGQDMPLVVAVSNEVAEESAKGMLGAEVIGFDTEWDQDGSVAVVQLATIKHCLLCLIPEVNIRQCPSLVTLLSDASVPKVGVAVALDAGLVREKQGIVVRGCVDLSPLAMREAEVAATHPVGLAALTQLLLGVELRKDTAVRKSNWAQRPLTAEQMEYAARDALAGRDCALELARRHKPSGVPLVEWCTELVDKESTKQRRLPKGASGEDSGRSQGLGSVRNGSSNGALNCGAYSCVTKFGLRPVLGSNGEPLLHMKERTVEGLLRRGLASICKEGDIETVRLHFTPADNYEYAGLDAAERNACVGCAAHGVARFYIVPRIFFVHLPPQCKSYNCHDVVMVCPACRAKAEPAQLALTQELLSANGAQRAGSRYANENALSAAELTAKKAASALKRGGKLPESKLVALRSAVATAFGIAADDLQPDHLELAAGFGDGPLPSERIVTSASQTPETLRAFLRQWRESFLKALKPRFLAEGWSLETGLDGRFVPSVASALEWPGDWRCPSCGVHCFGRSEHCRACFADKPSDVMEDRPEVVEENGA